jgi:predicted peptidase
LFFGSFSWRIVLSITENPLTFNGSNFGGPGRGNPQDATKLINLPIWVFHGDEDKTVLPERSQEMVDAIRAAGGEPRFTIYPGVGHNAWVQTYNDPEFYSWLFSQKRP